MIKTTLGVLANANTPSAPGQASPLGVLMQIKMPIQKAWARLETMEIIEIELARYNRLRDEIVKRYGSVKKNGQFSVTPEDEKHVEAMKELTDLAAIEVELAIEPIKLADLGDGELSPYDLRALRRFLLVA